MIRKAMEQMVARRKNEYNANTLQIVAGAAQSSRGSTWMKYAESDVILMCSAKMEFLGGYFVHCWVLNAALLSLTATGDNFEIGCWSVEDFERMISCYAVMRRVTKSYFGA